jgi:hypothetical protein
MRFRLRLVVPVLVLAGAAAAWIVVPVALSQEIDPGGGTAILCQAKYDWPQGGATIEHATDYLQPMYSSYSAWRYYPVDPYYDNFFIGSRHTVDGDETYRYSWQSEPYGGAPEWHYSYFNSTDVYRYTQIDTYGQGFKYSMEQWAQSHC